MKKGTVALIGVIGLGVILRVLTLTQRGSFWFDEAFAVHFASMDISQMLSYLRFENNPPLYFILLHFWMKIFGDSELTVRILSMLFGIAALPLTYYIGKRLHSKTAGLFAVFLMAISTFQVFYATETRMYTMYLFLALAVMWLFVERWNVAAVFRPPLWRSFDRLRTGSEGRRYIAYDVALFVLLSALIWTHITVWIIVLALGFYLLWQSEFNIKQFIRNNARFIIISTLLVIQFLPWAIKFIQLKIITPVSAGFVFYIPPDKNFFPTILENFLAFGQDNSFIITLLSVVIVGCMFFALRPITRSGKFLFCWLFIPLLIGFAFSSAITRYFIAVSPALYLLMGIGFANFVERVKRAYTIKQLRILYATGYLLVFALIFPAYASLAQLWPPVWDGLAQWVEEMQNLPAGKAGAKCKMQDKNCLVLINPHSEILPFERYYRGALPVVGFYPKDDSDDRDTRIVKTNWISLNTKENISRLADITKGYERVFLVTGGIDPIGRNLPPTWFWENGWRRGALKEFGRLSVVVLERL
ncbi:MAG: glycosyltransferase family 39 protein [bacterium]|nr:glycosyltransferase family 39 protein [bacterium]